MAPTLSILVDEPRPGELVNHLGLGVAALYAAFLRDTLAVARAVPGAHVVVRYGPTTPTAILTVLEPLVELVASPSGARAIPAALADGFASGGPVVLVAGDVPHLPLWRLRDALTYLDNADLVIGPREQRGWYLFGMRRPLPDLIPTVPNCRDELQRLVAAARLGGHVLHLLPPWFGVQTLADLASLGEALRTMPPQVAANTRLLLEGGASRAVGG